MIIGVDYYGTDVQERVTLIATRKVPIEKYKIRYFLVEGIRLGGPPHCPTGLIFIFHFF